MRVHFLSQPINKRCVCFISAWLFSAFYSTTFSLANSFDQRWGPWVELGGRFGDGRSIGETNLFAPIWQSPASLLFIDLRSSFDNRSAIEGNFGLGYRHMLDNGWNLGAYGYLDIRRTSLDNTFHQATFGFEALSSYLDLRANAYLPLGDHEKLVTTGTSSSSTSTDHIAVLTGTSLAIQSQITTKLGASYLVERAMAGFDAEAGVRLPIFPDEMKLDFRAFAGGYHFETSGMENLSGPRARLELAARDFAGLPGVRLTGGLTWQHDKPRGNQLIASVSLRLPFHAHKSREKSLTYMEDRMLDAVVRDVDIVTSDRAESHVSTNISTMSEAAINTWNDELVTSVSQVDASTGQSGLEAALATGGAGAVVIANGDFVASRTLRMGDKQTLLGGGTALLVRGQNSGAEVEFSAPGTSGALEGFAGSSYIIQMANRSVLGGMSVKNSYAGSVSNTVLIFNAEEAGLFGNYLEAGQAPNSTAAHVYNSRNIKIYNNIMRSNTSAAIIEKSSDVEIINNNLISNNYETISARDDVNNLHISKNYISTLNHHGSAILICRNNGAMLIADNTIGAENIGTPINADGANFQSGSTGNIDLSNVTPRCKISGPGSGMVEFVTGPHCSYP